MACSVLESRFLEGLCYLIHDRWVVLIDIKSMKHIDRSYRNSMSVFPSSKV